jgi:hypothetical protein
MKKPIAWIIEPAKGGDPYLTLKEDVANKRREKGDYVTEYVSQKPETQDEEEEL